MRLIQLWEVVANLLLVLLVLAISPFIFFMMAVMIMIGAMDYLLMGRRL